MPELRLTDRENEITASTSSISSKLPLQPVVNLLLLIASINGFYFIRPNVLSAHTIYVFSDARLGVQRGAYFLPYGKAREAALL